MTVGAQNRPPLSMRLWLAQRFGGAGHPKASSVTPGHGLSKNIESIEHIVRGRLRLFLRHTLLVTVLGTAILAGGLWGVFYLTSQATVMRIAVGPADGIDAKLAHILAEKLAQHRDRIDLKLVATTGPAQSAQAIADHAADLAILPGTIGSAPDWPVVAILRQNVMALIVPAPGTRAPVKGRRGRRERSEKLEKVSQLAGRRVGIVGGTEASADLLRIILKQYGVPLDKVQVSQIEPSNLAAAIRDNQVDVIFVAGPATGHAIADAVAAASHDGEAPTFIAIDRADGLAKRDPALEAVDIDAGTFGGNPPAPGDSLKSLGFPEYLVARSTLNNDRIATLARLIYTSRLGLAAALPGEVKIQAPSTDKDAQVLLHQGAHDYLADDQKSFFDKYGDDIFYSLLIFPLFGSAIAAVAGYFRHSSRTRRLRLLQRLIDLVRKAHAAPSLDALDQIQVDLDNLVIAIIHQGEHEEYDETVHTSFSLALDQVRFAIAARREMLLDHAGSEAKSATKAAAA